MAKNQLNQAIQAGIEFLVNQPVLQSDSSPRPDSWIGAYHYQTSFVPSLILNCLKNLPDQQLLPLKQQLVDFLFEQLSADWSCNYWARTSDEAKVFPYPDDLDDSFCALIALHSQQPELIEQQALAGVVRLLIATETKPGGPYRTWLTTDANWQDVDIAVNANILRFMNAIGSALPPLTQYLTRRVSQNQLDSVYYPSIFPILYYLVDAKISLPTSLITKNKPHNSLEQALALNVLVRVAPNHRRVAQLTQQLIEFQQPDGSWLAAAFCLDPSRSGQTYYHGSASLSTALALEALDLANRLEVPSKLVVASGHHNRIVAQATIHLKQLPASLRQPGLAILKTMAAADPQHHITLLPYLFRQSLPSLKSPSDRCVQLGLANLYGWMAYTIYDDFFDDEGQPVQLSVANWALRSSVDIFRTIPNDSFQQLVTKTFNTMDNANAWEVSHCRWKIKDDYLQLGQSPNYQACQKLAERSLGHSLTPLALLLTNGYKLNSRAVTSFQTAFRHYLIVRQLDDDAHDWQTDIRHGHITYVLTTILESLNLRGSIAFKELLPPMQRQFWNHGLVTICETMQAHIKQGRAALGTSQLMAECPLLNNLFDKQEASVKQSLAKQKQARNFLRHYKNS